MAFPAHNEISIRDHGPSRLAKISAAVAYCLTSTLLTVLNKYVLSGAEGGFSHVNFLICVQQCFIFTFIFLGHLLKIVELKYAPFWRQPTFWAVFCTFVLYVLTSLQALRFVNLPLFTVLRKTGVLFTVIAEWLLLSKLHPDRETWIAVVVILIGAFVSGCNDLEYDFSGYLLCFLCNFATSAYIIAVAKHNTTELKVDTANLLFQCAIFAIPLFFLFSLLTGELFQAIVHIKEANVKFSAAFMVSSLLAGLLNISAVLNTRLNSPTTQSICANFKDVLVVIVAQVVKPTLLSLGTVCGLVCTFAGACIHSFKGVASKVFESCGRLSTSSSQRRTVMLSFFFISFLALASLRFGDADVFTANATLLPYNDNLNTRNNALGRKTKGDVVATYDNTDIDSAEGEFIFYTFLWNKILEGQGNFDHYTHYHKSDCYARRDVLDRKDESVFMDPHWCRIIIIWKLLDEGFDRVLYIDTDILLVPDFTFDKFVMEAVTLTDFLPYQNKTTHVASNSSLFGICIQEHDQVFITSGLLLFRNDQTTYRILKRWLSFYTEAAGGDRLAGDQIYLDKALRADAEASSRTSLTCSRSLWSHYFNRMGSDVRRQNIKEQLKEHMRQSLREQKLETPYSHLLESQQTLVT